MSGAWKGSISNRFPSKKYMEAKSNTTHNITLKLDGRYRARRLALR
jgi:hypothetical protein